VVRRPYLALVAVCSGWGTIPVLVQQVDLPASAIVAVRLWVGAAGLGTVLWMRRADGPRRPTLLSVRPGWCVAAAMTLAVHWTFLFAAYRRAPAGTVILIVYLAPVGVAVVAPWALGERSGPAILASLGLALAGFALLAAPALHGAGAIGLGMATGASASFVALIVLSKPLAEVYGGLRLAFMEMAGAGMVLVPVALATAWGPPRAAWLWLVVLGLLHTALGTSLYLGALSRVPATQVGILGYLEPASVVLCAWLLLGQRPTPATLVGGGLVAVAGALVVLVGRGERPANDRPGRERPAPERPAPDRPGRERPGRGRPARRRAGAEQPEVAGRVR